jgi:hypothetical protein
MWVKRKLAVFKHTATTVLAIVKTQDFRLRHGVDEVFALLSCYAAYVGSFLPTFRDSLSVPSSRTDRLSRNIDKQRMCVAYQQTSGYRVKARLKA